MREREGWGSHLFDQFKLEKLCNNSLLPLCLSVHGMTSDKGLLVQLLTLCFNRIGIYLTVVMSMTAVSVILTVIVLNLHHKTARSWRLASWVIRGLDIISPLCCIGSAKDHKINEQTIDKMQTGSVGSKRKTKQSVKFADQTNSERATTTTTTADTSNRAATNISRSGPMANSESSYNCLDSVFVHQSVEGSVKKSLFSKLRSATSTQQIIRLRSSEFLDELESEMNILERQHTNQNNFEGLPPDHALALAVIKLMERHSSQAKTDDIIKDWRRLAQIVDRFLFWLFFITVVFFTVFILKFAPEEKLL